MKKSILYCIACIALTACELTETPQSSITPSTSFQTESDLQQYTNQFYTQLPDADGMYNENSNLIVNGNSLSDLILNYTRTVPSSGGGWTWTMLRHINFYFQYHNNCTNVSARQHYDGVAYFWRAWFYFNKLKRFGEVPLYTEPIKSDDVAKLKRPRDSRDKVTNFILADLDSAIAYLPTTKSTYEVTKWTALALKSRVCLFEGTFRKYHAGDAFNPNSLPYQDLLNKGAAAAEELMNSKQYKLYTDGTEPYRDLFASLTARTDEVILARCYWAEGAHHFVNQFAMVGSKGKPGFTRALTDSYLMKDGTRYTAKSGYETTPFWEEFKNRDPRMAQTMFHPGYIQQGKTETAVFSFDFTCTGYPIIKYVMSPDYDVNSICDMPVFRLAEVYLNYAECKAEAGVLTQADLDKSINLLRDRVKMPHLDMTTANGNPDPWLESADFGYVNVDKGTNKGVILEIRRERGIELVCEGHRYYDLMRWKEGRLFTAPFYGVYIPGADLYDFDQDGDIETMIWDEGMGIPYEINVDMYLKDNNTGWVVAHKMRERTFDEGRDYLYPIPTSERMLSDKNLTQNPGWDDGL